MIVYFNNGMEAQLRRLGVGRVRVRVRVGVSLISGRAASSTKQSGHVDVSRRRVRRF